MAGRMIHREFQEQFTRSGFECLNQDCHSYEASVRNPVWLAIKTPTVFNTFNLNLSRFQHGDTEANYGRDPLLETKTKSRPSNSFTKKRLPF